MVLPVFVCLCMFACQGQHWLHIQTTRSVLEKWTEPCISIRRPPSASSRRRRPSARATMSGWPVWNRTSCLALCQSPSLSLPLPLSACDDGPPLVVKWSWLLSGHWAEEEGEFFVTKSASQWTGFPDGSHASRSSNASFNVISLLFHC